MKSNTTTHINTRREESKRLQAFVMECLGWSELQYCLYKYNQGLAYLQTYLADRGMYELASRVEMSRLFWQWWKNQWTLREAVFEMKVDEFDTLTTKNRMYRSLNDGICLARDLHPHKIILNEEMQIAVELSMKQTV